MEAIKSISDKGKAGEEAFNQWPRGYNLSYVSVCQSKESFSTLFPFHVKRPDFLLLFEALGMIAIDIKNYQSSGGVFTLKYEEELRRSIAFERLFRIPVWYVFCDPDGFGMSWYWISALKAVEVGDKRTNENTRQEFLAIKKTEFAHICTADDLALLYTQRLPSVTKLASAC